MDNIIDTINFPIRKGAHAAEYFVLTFLIIFALRRKDTWNLDIRKAIVISIITCFLYSLTDEVHQLFVPARSGQFIDCITDTLGGCAAIIVYLIGYNLKKIIKTKSSKIE